MAYKALLTKIDLNYLHQKENYMCIGNNRGLQYLKSI